MNDTQRVASMIQELVLADFAEPVAPPTFDLRDHWRQVRATGTELWLDTGDLEAARALWCAEFQALTTNNTLLNNEVQKGIYDELVGRVAGPLRDVVPEDQLVIEIAFLLNAYHGMKLVHAFGGKVSVELHTDLAHDVERTLAYARRYHAICPDHFYVKVPMAPAGFVSVRRLAAEGIPVNFTLGFGARQNVLAAAFSRPAFVNVFLGRLNSVVAKYGLGDGKNVGEKATLSCLRHVRELRDRLDVPTRLIAASMRDAGEIASLAGCDVFTMPTQVAAAFDANPVTVTSQVDSDPPVSLAEGVDAAAAGLGTLWDVPDAFGKAVDDLVAGDADAVGPEELMGFFAERGLGGLLPAWTPEELATITADGKIPVLDRWADRIASGEIGLDALMNVSALCAFQVDQTAMDDRIRQML